MVDTTASHGHVSHQKEESIDETEQERKRQRKERAVKEREEKIKAELGRVEVDIDRSRQGINKEEGERDYLCAFIIPFLLAFIGGAHDVSLQISGLC